MLPYLLDLWLGVGWEGRASLGALRYLLAALSAFAVVLAASVPFLGALDRRRLVESQTKGDAPKLDELSQKKAGTPTLGGILLFGGALASALLWGRLEDRSLLLLLAYAVSLAALGFADDATKLATKRKGLRARTKLGWQVGISCLVAAYLYLWPPPAPPAGPSGSGLALFVPFGGAPLELGIVFVPLSVFVLVGASNAANLTDGLDGLAAGTASIAIAPLFAFACLTGRTETALFLAALLGGALGFLWLNCHPARIFMGDTGSLPLGGALGLAAVLSRAELLLLVAGAVFVAEALSVILQVASFQLTGRRIFLIAPLHHHFQYLGWPETKVTARFWIAGALAALAAFAGLYA